MDSLEPLLEMDVSLEAIVPTRDAAIALAADRLAEKTDVGYERIKSALFARERLGSTALGRGAAIPHAALRECTLPACAFIRLSSPVDFDAPDVPGVDAMLAVIWPQTDMHGLLGLLSSASRVLADPATLLLIRGAASPDLVRRSIFFGVRADMRLLTETDGDNGGRVATFGSPIRSREGAPDRTCLDPADRPERRRSNG